MFSVSFSSLIVFCFVRMNSKLFSCLSSVFLFLFRIVRILEDESEDMQICYNLIACVWLLSFKPACIPYFEERRVKLQE